MIIVDLCGNHLGDKVLLREMVHQAAENGAAFIKIQSFFAEDLAPDWKQDYDRIKRTELDWGDHADFVSWCKTFKVEAMTSVYTADHIAPLWEAGFKWVKFGSAQAMNDTLIKMYKAVGFKCILSTGGHNLRKLPHFGPLEGVLHCVSRYPHPPEEINILRMKQIPFYWPNTPYGLSDHSDPYSKNWAIPSYVAMVLGASYVEKHFTLLDRCMTKDGPVSITPDQLKELSLFEKLPYADKVQALKDAGVAIDYFLDQDHPEEKLLISRYEKRWTNPY